MAALTRHHIYRQVRLTTPIDDTTRTRIAALPGITRADLSQDGDRLIVEYDLRETELQTWLQQARACGVQPVDSRPARIQRWLAAWRDHNRQRHLLMKAGWHQYLQSAFLMAAKPRTSKKHDMTPRKSWQRYLNEDGRRTTETS